MTLDAKCLQAQSVKMMQECNIALPVANEPQNVTHSTNVKEADHKYWHVSWLCEIPAHPPT